MGSHIPLKPSYLQLISSRFMSRLCWLCGSREFCVLCCSLSSAVGWGVVAGTTGCMMLTELIVFENWVLRIQWLEHHYSVTPQDLTMMSTSYILCFSPPLFLSCFPHSVFMSSPTFASFYFSLTSHFVFFSTPPDHSPQTVETCVWWIGREPQQHKCCHVYTETLREVSYCVQQLHSTRYCYSRARGTVGLRLQRVNSPTSASYNLTMVYS